MQIPRDLTTNLVSISQEFIDSYSGDWAEQNQISDAAISFGSHQVLNFNVFPSQFVLAIKKLGNY